MSKKEESPQEVIDSYKKRQQVLPFVIGGVAVVLVLVGVIILVVWLSGSGKSLFAPAATETPTPTNTFTPSPTIPSATPSFTATITETPTATLTMTPSGPSEYVVQEGDTCWGLAEKFQVEFQVLMAINSFTDTCPIVPGGKIFIPAPDAELPTPTDIPTGIAPGTILEYTVQFGDTLAIIAARFSSSVDVIVADNNIKDVNAIDAGLKLKIRVNIATATKTLAPTSTSAAGMVQPSATSNVISAASATMAQTATLTPTK